jgi:acetoin utilization deacetylase AcuC-like enzyme
MLHFLRRFGRALPTWHHGDYRLPLASAEGQLGLEPRRADLACWWLVESRVLAASELRRPRRARYEELALVHTPDYLESLSQPETLARIFAVDPSEVPVDEALRTVRLAVGGTIEAAREALISHGATLNLLGGFHHAGPARGGGLCALNDVAVAVAVLRKAGFDRRVVVLDLDAHPPDGTAECLRADAKSWIGSLSGVEWAALPGVDERALPEAGDDQYLRALDDLLSAMPRPQLAFVLAGGDVLAGDRLGKLRLTLDGARRRDLAVARRLKGVPSVWLPAGGYSPQAWKVLAGTALALRRGSRRPVPDRDPLSSRFAAIARGLPDDELRDSGELSEEDLSAELTLRPAARHRLLHYYSAEGLEFALYRYGLFDFLERLGYGEFRVAVDAAVSGGDRVRVFGHAGGDEHLLVECVLQRQRLSDHELLYVHWLSLRNPRAHFVAGRPPLPGQDAPGLGLAREVGELLVRVADRLGLDGVAFRPSWYHTAYAARHRLRFADGARQGRFEALMRDLGGLPLADATRALAEGRVRLNGVPYTWEADAMVQLRKEEAPDQSPDQSMAQKVAAARESSHFTVQP